MYYRTFYFSGSIQKESKDFEVTGIFSKLTLTGPKRPKQNGIMKGRLIKISIKGRANEI